MTETPDRAHEFSESADPEGTVPKSSEPAPDDERLTFLADEARRELWERPVRVVNALELQGLPARQYRESPEISPAESIDVDNRALGDPQCPAVVLGRPHAGELVPESLYTNLTDEGRDTVRLIDRGTGTIFRSRKIPSVGTQLSRFIVDPNRAPLPGQRAEHSTAPGTVLWRTGMSGKEMYRTGTEPSGAEERDLVERFYLPYYRAMMGVIGSVADRREDPNARTLVLDGHSFPTNLLASYWEKYYGITDLRTLPMFIVGDGDGKFCDADVREAFLENLRRNFTQLPEAEQRLISTGIQGGVVEPNLGLKGVHNVQFYGQRSEGVNALQLECNETMYMDEEQYGGSYNERKLAIVQGLVERTCLETDPLLKSRPG